MLSLYINHLSLVPTKHTTFPYLFNLVGSIAYMLKYLKISNKYSYSKLIYRNPYLCTKAIYLYIIISI